MEIRKVSTLAFAVSKEKEKEIERNFTQGASRFLGMVPSEKAELRKGYYPVIIYKLSRPQEVHKGITRQTVYERRENNFFVNMTTGLLYHMAKDRIESFDVLNKVLEMPADDVRALGGIIRRGEAFKEDIGPNTVTNLANAGLIKMYKPLFKEMFTAVMDDIVADSDDGKHIKHTNIKERVNVNIHLPKFEDPGFDLYSYLKTTNVWVEDYSKEPIKYSVDHIADLLKYLFESEVRIDGVVFIPYISGAYQSTHNVKSQRIAEVMFPVSPKAVKEVILGGVEIKPISLSTELGAFKAVPIERETINFSDVAALEEIKEEIREEIIYPIIRPDLAKQYGRRGGGGILLYGPPGCGKTYIAKAAIGECGAAFYNINVSDLVKKGFEDGAKALHDIFEQAGKNPPAIIFFDEFDAVGGKREAKQQQAEKMLINQLLTEMDGVESLKENVLFIAATNAPWAVDPALRRAGRFTKQLFVPPPDLKARQELFKLHTKKEPLDDGVDYDKLAELTDGYSSADLKAISDAAIKIPWEEAMKTGVQRKATMQDFMKAISKQKSSLLSWYKAAYKQLEESGELDTYKEYSKHILKYAGGVDLVKKPKISFKDVGDLEEVKEEIRRSVIYPMSREDLAKEFGQSMGGGILLNGPPGCGKTYIAKAAAGECNASFFNIQITDILSPEEGGSEKKIRDVFERAGRNTPSILFFDEIEGIAGRRDALGIDAVRLVDAFLTELDGFKKTKGLIVMGATNSPWAIDPALRRSDRFTKQIFIPPPNTEARMQIFQIHCKEAPIGPDIDFDALAKVTENYASSDIKAICHTAASIPWEEALKGAAQRKVSMDDFIRAIAKTKSSLTPWITMAKRELEKSGETDVYKDLYRFLSNYRSCTAEEYKEMVKQEKEDLEMKKEDELKFLEIRRTEVADKIKMAQYKYYKRELSSDNFRDIISDYEKQLIELDMQITRMKREDTPNKTGDTQSKADDKQPKEN
jgi:transitional endoplasmic reticulum ATPase